MLERALYETVSIFVLLTDVCASVKEELNVLDSRFVRDSESVVELSLVLLEAISLERVVMTLAVIELSVSCTVESWVLVIVTLAMVELSISCTAEFWVFDDTWSGRERELKTEPEYPEPVIEESIDLLIQA